MPRNTPSWDFHELGACFFVTPARPHTTHFIRHWDTTCNPPCPQTLYSIAPHTAPLPHRTLPALRAAAFYGDMFGGWTFVLVHCRHAAATHLPSPAPHTHTTPTHHYAARTPAHHPLPFPAETFGRVVTRLPPRPYLPTPPAHPACPHCPTFCVRNVPRYALPAEHTVAFWLVV